MKRSGVVCHDRTPFIDVLCPGCFQLTHFHESSLAGAEVGAKIGVLCHSCSALLAMPLEDVRRLFAEEWEPEVPERIGS